ncbi:Ferric/cupric reductase transmembrane component B [Paramyrothecium foliicola]|nr:Ferric/cupric reductase transmembrane component B [Paramyrothecium foliicola]
MNGAVAPDEGEDFAQKSDTGCQALAEAQDGQQARGALQYGLLVQPLEMDIHEQSLSTLAWGTRRRGLGTSSISAISLDVPTPTPIDAMPVEIQDIDPSTDFPDLSRAMFKAHETPLQPFFHVFFPTLGGGGYQAREDAIAEGAVRLHSWLTKYPRSYWQKAIDSSTGSIVGAALWYICQEDPFADGQDDGKELTWFPDDGSRRFAEQYLDIYDKPRLRAGRRPQVYLFILFVDPDYRRQGIGSRLLKWGMDKADDLAVEMFLDSTSEGKPLYDRHKFHTVEKNVISPQMDNPDEAWKGVKNKVGDTNWWLMWRPVRGEYKEGRSQDQRNFDASAAALAEERIKVDYVSSDSEGDMTNVIDAGNNAFPLRTRTDTAVPVEEAALPATKFGVLDGAVPASLDCAHFGTSIAGVGIIIVYMSVTLYLIETFTIYAASALATNTAIRSIAGAALPLAGLPMFDALGLGWGNSLLAFIGLLLVPVAFVWVRYAALAIGAKTCKDEKTYSNMLTARHCFACRNVIRKQQLSCTPSSGGENHGTAHNPVSTPPDCFVSDPPFLKTMALCIDTYCPLSGDPSMDLIEDYWSSHLGTGTLGNYEYVPVMTYHEALAAAKSDETQAAGSGNSTNPEEPSHDHMRARVMRTRRHNHGGSTETGIKPFNVSSPLPVAAGGSAGLNVTSFVAPEAWQMQYNYMSDFEINETGHSTMTIVIAVVAIFLPIGLSLLKFLPGISVSRTWMYVQSVLVDPPAWGVRHRVPAAVGLVPTRGQTLYISIISFLNIILLLAPYVINQPQASFSSTGMQTLSIVGNRAGSMAMGNVVALVLFAARNNVLFYVTDWSYSTYLLLHRWLGYWAIFHTILHSFMLMANYIIQGTYNDELIREYWIWGIVGTVAASAILLFSLLWIRQKFYEFFLASHIILSLLFLIGYYYHIWYCYSYNWGYEIWMFIAGAIWGIDRVVRLGRMAIGGSRTAIIQVLQDTDGEYLRIDVQGSSLKGEVVYLCFPTLSWRFWETHPFSVACTDLDDSKQPLSGVSNSAILSTTTKKDVESSNEKSEHGSQGNYPAGSTANKVISSTTFFCRTRTGITNLLAARASKSEGLQVRVRVLVEGPYNHSGGVASQLARCGGVLGIAGGVGITGCLSYMKYDDKDVKLFWSNRKSGLARDMAPILAQLPDNVQVETVVGQRLGLDSILSKELLQSKDNRPLAIVVCGPPGMADEVRRKVTWLARFNSSSRPYELIDEAFSCHAIREESQQQVLLGFPHPNPTESYWQDPPHRIANHRTTADLPSNQTFDYVIVGSGITGATVAYKLLSRDPETSILMLEARTAASGASGRNGGHARSGSWKKIKSWIDTYGEDEGLKVGKMEQDSIDDLADFVRTHNISNGWRDVETADVYWTKEAFADAVKIVEFQRELEARRPNDVPKNDRTVYAGQEARDHWRWPEILGAVTFSAHTQNPYLTVCAMLEQSLSNGLNLQTNTLALGLSPLSGRSKCGAKWEVKTNRGTVKGKQVVLATNAYTNALHPGFADTKFLVPGRSQCSAVHPERDTAGNPVFGRSTSYPDLHSGNNYIAPGTKTEGDVIYGGGTTFSPTREKNITDDSVVNEVIAAHLQRVARVTYGYKNWGETTEVIKDWTGITCDTPDGLPVVGGVPGEEGLWASVCMNGHGMAWGFRSAEALVEMMTEGAAPEWFPTAFRAERAWEVDTESRSEL